MGSNERPLEGCSVCEFLRRECQPKCFFAPLFPRNKPERLEKIHRFYGFHNFYWIIEHISSGLNVRIMNRLVKELDANAGPPQGVIGNYLDILSGDVKLVRSQMTRLLEELDDVGMYSKGSISSSGVHPFQPLRPVDWLQNGFMFRGHGGLSRL
ncbi:protein IAL1-like [Wolffia australiana]